jgi:hypothetical protein
MLKEVFGGFSQLLQASARVLPELTHDYILPDPFQFIIHQSLYHQMLYGLLYCCHIRTNYAIFTNFDPI